MAHDKPIPIANAAEAPTGGRHAIPEGLYLMWMGAYGDTKVYVWADSFDDAFELMVEWADENAPGMLYDLTVDDLKESADAMGIEWDPEWPDYEDRDFEKVREHAEDNSTSIGHTTLNNGQYIRSDEWGGDQITDKATIEEVARQSLLEAFGHDFLVGDEVIWKGYDRDAGDPDLYTVTASSGNDLDLEAVVGDAAYDNVDTGEVAHA